VSQRLAQKPTEKKGHIWDQEAPKELKKGSQSQTKVGVIEELKMEETGLQI